MTTVGIKPTTQRLMNVQQFAELLGVTPSCIRRWILERRVKVIKLGRLVRIPVSEADRLTTEGLHTASTGNELNALQTESGRAVRQAKS